MVGAANRRALFTLWLVYLYRTTVAPTRRFSLQSLNLLTLNRCRLTNLPPPSPWGSVYLPTLLAPELCYKLPIAVGYTCVAVGKVRDGGVCRLPWTREKHLSLDIHTVPCVTLLSCRRCPSSRGQPVFGFGERGEGERPENVVSPLEIGPCEPPSRVSLSRRRVIHNLKVGHFTALVGVERELRHLPLVDEHGDNLPIRLVGRDDHEGGGTFVAGCFAFGRWRVPS